MRREEVTIAKRLLVLVLVSVAGLLSVGGLGLWGLHSIGESIHYIDNNVLPSVRTIDDANAEYFLLRTEILRHVMTADDPAAKSASMARSSKRVPGSTSCSSRTGRWCPTMKTGASTSRILR